MSHRWIRVIVTVLLIATVLLIIRLHRAGGAVMPESISAGHRLAKAWCAECHAVEPDAIHSGKGPAFVRIANLPSTTALSLTVFLRSNHTDMPNFIIAPADAAEIVQYILSLKRN